MENELGDDWVDDDGDKSSAVGLAAVLVVSIMLAGGFSVTFCFR